MEVRLEYLKPKEIETAMAACPTLFLPIGTVEWHGVHNIVGLDALKAHALCVQAAQQGGGLVHPPLYGGVGGLNEPHTFIFDPENELSPVLLPPWLEQLCRETARNGFKAAVLLTGHYGAAQQIAVRRVAVRMTEALGIPVLGTPEYFLALDEEYYGDHAAFFETSIMMYLFPGTVDLDRLGTEPYQGVGGKDPKRYANVENDGRRISQAIVRRLARLAQRMPQWDEVTRKQFLEAERALVDRQFSLASVEGKVWGGWRHIAKGVFNDYPRCLEEERFGDIVKLVEQL
jgi:creatinine amidohydrolase